MQHEEALFQNSLSLLFSALNQTQATIHSLISGGESGSLLSPLTLQRETIINRTGRYTKIMGYTTLIGKQPQREQNEEQTFLISPVLPTIAPPPKKKTNKAAEN